MTICLWPNAGAENSRHREGGVNDYFDKGLWNHARSWHKNCRQGRGYRRVNGNAGRDLVGKETVLRFGCGIEAYVICVERPFAPFGMGLVV